MRNSYRYAGWAIEIKHEGRWVPFRIPDRDRAWSYNARGYDLSFYPSRRQARAKAKDLRHFALGMEVRVRRASATVVIAGDAQ
jgi:hypothetical protein